MGVRGVRVAGLLAAAALACAGCTGADSAGTEPTVPTAPSTTPAAPPTTVDIATIPEVIDEEYLNRVLAALDEVDGMATRVIVANKGVVPEAAEILNSIYSDERFSVQADAWLSALERDPELRSIKAEPGNRRTTVDTIIAGAPECVWMAVLRDYSATDTTPRPPRVEYLALRPLDESNDPKGRNRTAWMIVADGFRRDGTEPRNPCQP